jgi:hypothetical protein
VRYEPRRDELTSDERRFLDLLAPTGLDWLATRADFAARHGISRYYDRDDVVALPASSAISEASLTWHMYAWPHLMDLPPEYLFASFMPYDHARKNHREIEGQLAARLGRPITTDSSNSIGRRWTFGIFSVDLNTWPPEMQPRAVLRSNVLHEREPRLVTASSVSFKTDYAHVYPDGSLDGVATQVDAAGRGGRAGTVLMLPPLDSHFRNRETTSIRHSRRNPCALARALRAGEAIAWVDEPGGRIGLSMPSQSLVFERTPPSALVLVRVEPARGSGGSLLYFRPRPPATSLGERGLDIELRGGGRMDSLDGTADRLSRFWNLPIVFESALDD